jgi:hypothetical protein
MNDGGDDDTSLYGAVMAKLEKAIQSTKNTQKICPTALNPNLAAFYIQWDREVNHPDIVLSVSNQGVVLKPLDHFCPLCDGSDVYIRYDGQYQPLSWHMNRFLETYLNEASCLEEVILDLFYTFNSTLSPLIHEMVPSLGSVNGACLIDQPRMTPKAIIDHYSIHTSKGIPILLVPMAKRAMNHIAARKIEAAHKGLVSPQELSNILKCIQAQTQSQTNAARFQVRSN